ncbi:MAG: alpha-glucan family phosphorylase [Bilophila wadsworthia]
MGFARRFAPYKRATLLFADLDRLARIVGNAERPVIFVFSGKAHPADTQGIDMLQEVIRHMLDPRFFGKIFFIEDYNLAVSRLMVQGCDVWLNTPRRPYEACGTSGQKVPVNAGVNLSISDGWWCEGYNGENGWTIGPAVTREYLCGEQSDYDDAGFLYALLEEKIVPLYFERNFEGMPHDWLLTVRQSMQSLIARFSSNRMVREYLNDYYIPAAQRYAELRDKHNALTKRLARWKQDVNARFSSLRIEQIRIEGLKGEELMGTQPMQVQIGVLPGGMKPEELLVQLVAGPGDGNGFTDTPDVVDMARTEESTADRLVYACAYSPSRSGPHVYGVRVLPVTPGLASPLETRLVLWG